MHLAAEKVPFLWIKYYVNGRPQYESTKTDKVKVAEQILKDREGRVATGQPTPARGQGEVRHRGGGSSNPLPYDGISQPEGSRDAVRAASSVL